MTKEEIIKLLGVLQDTYGKRFSDPAGTVEAWSLVLGAYDSKQIYKAARFYMETKTIKNFPSPADLIDLIHQDADTVRKEHFPDTVLASVAFISHRNAGDQEYIRCSDLDRSA